jgi:hypothetical protein
MARHVQKHRDDLKVVFAHSIHDEAYLAHPTAARRQTVKMIARLVEQAQSCGQARRDLAADEQARQLLGLYNNAVLAIVFGSRSAAAAIRSLWSFALGGMCARDTLAR